MMISLREKWENGLSEELYYWDAWLEGRLLNAEERAFRLSSNRPFPWWVKPLIPKQADEVRILDVGAGPVTELGAFWEGREVEIVAVDPLAEPYGELLKKYSVNPPVRTINGSGEQLVRQFGEDAFHFVFARNSLDRSVEPIECYREIIRVLRPGCSLVTLHEANNGEKNNYEGVNQWNFSLSEQRLMVWNHTGNWELVEQLEDVGSHRVEMDRNLIKLTLTKKAAPASA